VLEGHRLGLAVDDRTGAVEPGEAEDGSDALEGQDAEGDVRLVLTIDVDRCCRCVQDLEQRSVGELDGAGRHDGDKGESERTSEFFREKLAVGAVVAQPVSDDSVLRPGGAHLHLPANRTEVRNLGLGKVGTIRVESLEDQLVGLGGGPRESVGAKEGASGGEAEREDFDVQSRRGKRGGSRRNRKFIRSQGVV
jgi:hypothetical protein